jgi:hypothetical protein
MWLTGKCPVDNFLAATDLSNRSHNDLNEEFMITGPGDLHARCVRCDALPQPLREDADGPAPGART